MDWTKNEWKNSPCSKKKKKKKKTLEDHRNVWKNPRPLWKTSLALWKQIMKKWGAVLHNLKVRLCLHSTHSTLCYYCFPRPHVPDVVKRQGVSGGHVPHTGRGYASQPASSNAASLQVPAAPWEEKKTERRRITVHSNIYGADPRIPPHCTRICSCDEHVRKRACRRRWWARLGAEENRRSTIVCVEIRMAWMWKVRGGFSYSYAAVIKGRNAHQEAETWPAFRQCAF